MVYERKQFKVDAFFVRANWHQKIGNLAELKKFIRRDEYFKYHVYRNSDGHMVFRVFNPDTGREELRALDDNDVLYYYLEDNGERGENYIPIWAFEGRFKASFI